MSPHFFAPGFVFGEVPKIKVTFATFLREMLFVLDVTHSQVDVKTEFGVVSLDSVSLSILASIKLYFAFSGFQRPRKMVDCFCSTFYPV